MDAPNWYRVDNAGKIFSAAAGGGLNTAFRLAITLHDRVHVESLQRALRATAARYPWFAVQLRPGFFWYRFDANPAEPRVGADNRVPCVDFRYGRRETFPFRVRAFGRRIAVEFAHALTDGTGALTFLRALTAAYLAERRGLSQAAAVLGTGCAEEFEDAFLRYARGGLPGPRDLGRAFHIPRRPAYRDALHITTGIVPAARLSGEARSRGISLTELLAAIALDALQELFRSLPPRRQRRVAAPIRLEVPVNLRRFFPSATMRNFFLPVHPEIDPRLGVYTFDEVADRVHHQMRHEVSDKELSRAMARNVGAERHPLLRLAPLFVKIPVMTEIYRRFGQRTTTMGLSNLGRVELDAALTAEVERVEFLPAHPNARRINCGIVGYGDRLYISFARTIEDPCVERAFFRRLAAYGAAVHIETN